MDPFRRTFASTSNGTCNSAPMTVGLSPVGFRLYGSICTGVPLTLDSSESVLLTTPGLTMQIQNVRSELANEVTDRAWSPFIGLQTDILPEVPPDGLNFHLLDGSFLKCSDSRRHTTILQRPSLHRRSAGRTRGGYFSFAEAETGRTVFFL